MNKHRSPAYPAIDLEEAIEKIKKLYPQGSRHPLGIEVVAELWGYKGLTSAAPYIAAAKQYGLMEEKRNGSERMLQLSEGAKDIASDPDLVTQEARAAIKAAATTPTIFQAMWDKWGRDLPPESEMRRFLERERQFNPNNVSRVVENFKAAISYAKLDGGDNIEEEPTPSGQRSRGEKRVGAFGGVFPDLFPPPSTTTMRELPITLPSLAIAVVKLPAVMSELDYNTLLASIQAWKPALVTQPKMSTSDADEDFAVED